MPQKFSKYYCVECRYSCSQWLGQCPECSRWNTLELQSENNKKNIQRKHQITSSSIETTRVKVNFGDCDVVFGEGILTGSVTLLAGEPGIGKSTILLQILTKIKELNNRTKILYVSGEESQDQIEERLKRLNLNINDLKVNSSSIWQEILEDVKTENYQFVIIDSIQTVRDDDLSSQAGTPTQLRAIASEIIENFKQCGITTILVGHVTKEGSIAGPKHVEHMVDTVLTFEKVKGKIRVLKARKNRFGSIDVEAFFRMEKFGLLPISIESLSPNFNENEVGVAYSLVRQANKPVIVEIQALVLENKFGQGKRVVQDLDLNMLNTILAIIEKELKIPLSSYDIFIKSSSKVKVGAVEMAISYALLSSYYKKSIKSREVYLGELRLSGIFSPMELDIDDKESLKKHSLSYCANDLNGFQKIENITALHNYFKDRAA